MKNAFIPYNIKLYVALHSSRFDYRVRADIRIRTARVRPIGVRTTPVRERGSVGRVQWCSEMVMTPVFLQSVANETCAIQSIQEWKTVTRCIENSVYTVPIPYPYRRELG